MVQLSGHGFVQVWVLFLNNAEKEWKNIFLVLSSIGTQEKTTKSIKPSHVISANDTVTEGII